MDTTTIPTRNTSFYIKRILGIILLLAMAGTFFYSAYSKSGMELEMNVTAAARAAHKGFQMSFMPVVVVETQQSDNAFTSFEWTFLDLGINSIFVAGIVARLMVGFEVLLGLLLLFHIFLRRFTYPLVIGVLSVFIIYLLLVILKQGNTGNCGCFGNNISMTPLAAIIKNLIMIGVTVLLMYIYPVRPYKHQEYMLIILCFVAFSMPFVVNAIYMTTAPTTAKEPVDLSPLYSYTPAPTTDLRTGKHIVAFMSLTCPHCRKAAYLLHVIHSQHPDIPIYMVLDGPEAYKKEFFDVTHTGDLPFLYFRHTNDFMKMAGPGVPAIFWMNNGVAEYKSDYYHMDPRHMEEWLSGKKISD